MLSEDDIKKYQQIYKKQYGSEITKEEALKQGTGLVTLARIVAKQYMKDIQQKPKKGINMNDNIWKPITDFLKNKRKLNLLSPLSNSQVFEVTEITDGYIKIQFKESKGSLKIEGSRFVSAYKMLEEKKGVWVPLGSSRVNTKPNTLEGRIKLDFNGKLNGLSTISWIATILVKVFDNIKFNYEAKGQALIMTDKLE